MSRKSSESSSCKCNKKVEKESERWNHHLSKVCKETIERLLQAQKIHREIAEAIGVLRTTIYRELGRACMCGRYGSIWAQNSAEIRKNRRKLRRFCGTKFSRCTMKTTVRSKLLELNTNLLIRQYLPKGKGLLVDPDLLPSFRQKLNISS